MREGFIHIRIDVPPAGRGRTWREWALLAFRPFWPLTRWALALIPSGSRARARAVQRVFPLTFAAINRRDWVFLEPHLARDYEIHTDPSVEMDIERVYRGRHAIREMMAGWNESFPEWRWEVADVVDGPGMWVGLGEVVGVAASSGVELRQRISIVARMKGAEIVSQHMFWDWTQALADAGLPPLDQIPKAP